MAVRQVRPALQVAVAVLVQQELLRLEVLAQRHQYQAPL